MTIEFTDDQSVVKDHHQFTAGVGADFAICGCGDMFDNNPEGYKEWQAHTKYVLLLVGVSELVRREYEARMESEKMIVDLVNSGVSTKMISEAIGEADGKPIMSATTVQRIARERQEKPEKPPRRRKR